MIGTATLSGTVAKIEKAESAKRPGYFFAQLTLSCAGKDWRDKTLVKDEKLTLPYWPEAVPKVGDTLDVTCDLSLYESKSGYVNFGFKAKSFVVTASAPEVDPDSDDIPF